MSITEVQGCILEFILVEDKDKSLFQEDIEKEFDLWPPTTIELSETLEEREITQRVSSEHDARYKETLSTETAEHIRLTLQQEIQRAEEQLMRGVPREKLDVFMRVARKMLLSLDN